MTGKRIPKGVLILMAVAAIAAAGLVLTRNRWRVSQQEQAGVYYCPMHPSYTSDHPGNCPICSMRLVKREAEPVGASAATPAQPAKETRDVCHLHNCPLAHAGQPCPMLVVSKPGEAVVCPICGKHIVEGGTAQGATILYWTDPMMPGYRSDKPGKSPMGMDMIPVYEEAGVSSEASAVSPAGYASILVTPQKRQFIGVTTAPVQRRTITKVIRTVGQIANDPELYQAEEEYLQALHALEQAKVGTIPEVTDGAQRLVDAGRLRLRRLGLSEDFIEDIAAWTGPDQSLLLADASGRVWLYAPIYEFELPLVTSGQSVTAELPSTPGKKLSGTIRSIDPILDATTRSARLRAVLTDPDHLLKPGMFVNVEVAVTSGDVLAVPEEAVFDTGIKRIVFVDKGQGLFEPRDVTVGIKADGYYEIKAGLAEGELAVTSSNFLIDSESRLKAAIEGFGGGEHAHGP